MGTIEVQQVLLTPLSCLDNSMLPADDDDT